MNFPADALITIFATTGFWTFATAIYNHHTAKNKHVEEDIAETKQTTDTLKLAILAILRDKLYFLCNKALTVQGITAEDRDNIRQLMEPYEALGGDGIIHDLYARVEELPLYINEE